MVNTTQWCLISHWEFSDWLWRIDFTLHPDALFDQLLFSYHERLMVIKAFETMGNRQQQIEERFAECHKGGPWYAPRPELRRFVEDEAMCETLTAKHLFGMREGRLNWRPARLDMRSKMERAQGEGELPKFVRNAERFVMWAVDDVTGDGEACLPRGIIQHPANSLYQPKTIYNTIRILVEQEKVAKASSGRLLLTDKGQEEIDGLKKVEELKRKGSVRTLRL
jgi:hypothetical protein